MWVRVSVNHECVCYMQISVDPEWQNKHEARHNRLFSSTRRPSKALVRKWTCWSRSMLWFNQLQDHLDGSLTYSRCGQDQIRQQTPSSFIFIAPFHLYVCFKIPTYILIPEILNFTSKTINCFALRNKLLWHFVLRGGLNKKL